MIMVINAGSSSVKFTLFGENGAAVLAKGIVERIGLSDTRLIFRHPGGAEWQEPAPGADTTVAVAVILAALTDLKHGVIEDSGRIRAVGHRVVHGGEQLTRSVIVGPRVKQVIQDCAELAPLHNPPNLKGIEACEHLIPGAVQVAVFDTAFHTTIPDYAYLYGLPYGLYRNFRIRRYGFHGISHKYVAERAAELLQRPLSKLCLITCHLGNGSSMTAVQGGVSVDTSMGFTPLEGLIMGTRCGDLDPAIIPYLMERQSMSPQEIDRLLNHQSGLLGLAEIDSSDFRDIEAAWLNGNKQAEITIKAFCYRIKKYIGAFVAVMGGLDALVFTAGIGENAPSVRELACEGFERRAGHRMLIDPKKNRESLSGPREIQADDSDVKVLVIPTDEEREIARQTLALIQG
jgi:acetate kinase